MIDIKHAFGFTSEPFPQDVKIEDLYPLPGLDALLKRFFYAVRLSAVSVITGDVGSGKSTSLRYATSKLHPSEFKVIPIVATTGSLLELFRQICLVFGIEYRSFSIALMTKIVRDIISEIAGGREGLFADEAVLAIHQGSGGLLRRANTLAKGALMAAAMEKCAVATAEHVRLASTEIL